MIPPKLIVKVVMSLGFFEYEAIHPEISLKNSSGSSELQFPSIISTPLSGFKETNGVSSEASL